MKKLKPVIAFILIATLSYSCTKTSTSSKPGQLLVSVKKDEVLDRIASALGKKYIRSFEIDLNTRNSKFTCYSGVLEYDQLDGNSSKVCYKLFNNRNMGRYSLGPGDSITYLKEHISYDLLFDEQMPKYLNNDKVYFSLAGKDVNEFCINGGFSSHSLPRDGIREPIADCFPVKLFYGGLTNRAYSKEEHFPECLEGETRYITMFQIGFLSYNTKSGTYIDFEAYFNDENVKYAMWGDRLTAEQMENIREDINVSRFARPCR